MVNPKKSVLLIAGLLRTIGSSMSRLLRLARWASSLPVKHRHSVVKRQTLFLKVYRSMAFKNLFEADHDWSGCYNLRNSLALVVLCLLRSGFDVCVTLQADYSPRL